MSDAPKTLEYAEPSSAPRRRIIPISFWLAVVQIPWWVLVALTFGRTGPKDNFRDTVGFIVVAMPGVGAVALSLWENRPARWRTRRTRAVALSIIALLAGIWFTMMFYKFWHEMWIDPHYDWHE